MAVTMAVDEKLERIGLAALFYEIGRVRKRAFAETGSYQEVGRRWLETKLPRVATDLQQWEPLIAEAAALSAGDALPEEPQEDIHALNPLVSFFSKVSLPQGKEGQRNQGPWGYYPLAPITEVANYPSPTVVLSRQHYQELWTQFEHELEILLDGNPGALTISQTLVLLEKFMSFLPFLPSDPQDPYSDIPLFDQMKGTAAIASCLYQAVAANPGEDADFKDKTKKRYLLVGGDFSGVQPFIYRIFSKGALKALKGRAVFLEILTEYVIRQLVEPLGFSRANLIYAGGSRFTLLLPSTEEARNQIAGVRRTMNTYLMRAHRAKLYLVLESIELVGTDFQPAPESTMTMRWAELARTIAGKKHHKFMEFLEHEDVWDFSRQQKCRYCGHWVEEADLCKAEELSTWTIMGQKGSELFPLCRFCFLLVPKEPVEQTPQRIELGRGRCLWCNNGTEVPLIKLELDGEDVFGCEQCLGATATKHGDCQVCHRQALLSKLPQSSNEEPIWACPFCRCLYHLGEHLPYVSTILETKAKPEEQPKVFLKIEETYYYFPLPPEGTPRARAARLTAVDFPAWLQKIYNEKDTTVWVLNRWEASDYQRPSVFPFLIGTYSKGLPEKAPVELEDLAWASYGTAKIGVLRMDIDSLGDIFREGFREEERTFARLSALSRSLNRFFKFHLNGLCRGVGLPSNHSQTRLIKAAGERAVVVVYAGGDDLFIIGSWDEVIELAFDLYAAFRAYTCYNPALTLSGGMLVQDHHYPVHHLAELAQRAVKNAKEHEEDDRKKDSLAPFYRALIFDGKEGTDSKGALRWEGKEVSAALARELVEELLALGSVEEGRWQPAFPRTFLHTLFRVVQDRKTRGQLSLPHLAYALSRLRLGEGQGAREDLEVKRKQLIQKLYASKTIRYLHPALVWVELLSREKGERRQHEQR